jgi:hypothetical protein
MSLHRDSLSRYFYNRLIRKEGLKVDAQPDPALKRLGIVRELARFGDKRSRRPDRATSSSAL